MRTKCRIKKTKMYSQWVEVLAACAGLLPKELLVMKMSEFSALWVELGLPKTDIYFRSKNGILDKKPFWTLGN